MERMGELEGIRVGDCSMGGWLLYGWMAAPRCALAGKRMYTTKTPKLPFPPQNLELKNTICGRTECFPVFLGFINT